jgi:hypothetical protein
VTATLIAETQHGKGYAGMSTPDPHGPYKHRTPFAYIDRPDGTRTWGGLYQPFLNLSEAVRWVHIELRIDEDGAA